MAAFAFIAASAAAAESVESVRHNVAFCPAETSTNSGVGAWYQLCNEDFISIGIELFMTTSKCIDKYACTHHNPRSTPCVLLYPCNTREPLHTYSAVRVGQSKTSFCKDNLVPHSVYPVPVLVRPL